MFEKLSIQIEYRNENTIHKIDVTNAPGTWVRSFTDRSGTKVKINIKNNTNIENPIKTRKGKILFSKSPTNGIWALIKRNILLPYTKTIREIAIITPKAIVYKRDNIRI